MRPVKQCYGIQVGVTRLRLVITGGPGSTVRCDFVKNAMGEGFRA